MQNYTLLSNIPNISANIFILHCFSNSYVAAFDIRYTSLYY